jgi:hypothetical protein
MGGTGRRVGWVAVAGMAVLALIGATKPAQAGSQSARTYYDGSFVNTYHYFQCIQPPIYEAMTGVYSGYYGTADVTWPRVGDVYYVHVVLSTVGGVCLPTDGYVEPELTLPPNTQLAISAANPVYCWAYNPQFQATQITAGNGCPTTPQYPSYAGRGTYSLYSTYNGTGPYSKSGWWALPTGYFLEFQVPVTSTQPMSGIATGSYVTGFTVDQSGEWAGAQEGVFVAPNDLIFKDGVESGNTTAWSASSQLGGGDLSVIGPAAMRGSTLGVRALVNDVGPLYLQDDHPVAAGRYRTRFYLSPNGWDPGIANGNQRVRVFLAFDGSNTRRIALVLRRIGTTYSLLARIRRDDGTTSDSAFYTISANPHSIEFDWKKSTGPGANNGSFTLWIDDVAQVTLSGIDNDLGAIEYARMGAMNIKTGANGTLWFDEFESRTTTPVGP